MRAWRQRRAICSPLTRLDSVELIVAIIALVKCELEVVQASLLGSMCVTDDS
jgi:hypothetical protein